MKRFSDSSSEAIRADCTPLKHRSKVVLLSQVYPPDAIAVGQHLHDVNRELVRRGFRVLVYTSNRAYNDPRVRYPRRQVLDGVDIVRLPLTSFGKKHMSLRIVAACSFILQATLHCLLTSRFEHLIVSTSPPMCVFAAIVIDLFRRTTITFWVMDLNPDQLVEFGKLAAGAWQVRLLDAINRRILHRAKNIVVLDRFMAARLLKKLDVPEKITILSPWPAIQGTHRINHAHNPFRRQHGWNDRRVIMYSGNHGIGLPLDTLLEAAVKFRNDPRVIFAFIGEGVRKADVERMIQTYGPSNVVSLPYQPLDAIPYSLSAADVHVVSVGQNVSGIFHPCKIYGAMAVGRPILLLGPIPNYASSLVEENGLGWLVEHGDVDRMVAIIQEIIEGNQRCLEEMGERSRRLVEREFKQEQLVGQFCDLIARDRLDPTA